MRLKKEKNLSSAVSSTVSAAHSMDSDFSSVFGENSLGADSDWDRPEGVEGAEGQVIKKKRKRENLSNLSIEEKKLRRKLKNRVAAQSARDRKKVQMEEAEAKVHMLEEMKGQLKRENEFLRRRGKALEDENRKLRETLSAKRAALGPLESQQRYDDMIHETVASHPSPLNPPPLVPPKSPQENYVVEPEDTPLLVNALQSCFGFNGKAGSEVLQWLENCSPGAENQFQEIEKICSPQFEQEMLDRDSIGSQPYGDKSGKGEMASPGTPYPPHEVNSIRDLMAFEGTHIKRERLENDFSSPLPSLLPSQFSNSYVEGDGEGLSYSSPLLSSYPFGVTCTESGPEGAPTRQFDMGWSDPVADISPDLLQL